jgi:hypothetical protein
MKSYNYISSTAETPSNDQRIATEFKLTKPSKFTAEPAKQIQPVNNDINKQQIDLDTFNTPQIKGGNITNTDVIDDGNDLAIFDKTYQPLQLKISRTTASKDVKNLIAKNNDIIIKF